MDCDDNRPNNSNSSADNKPPPAACAFQFIVLSCLGGRDGSATSRCHNTTIVVTSRRQTDTQTRGHLCAWFLSVWPELRKPLMNHRLSDSRQTNHNKCSPQPRRVFEGKKKSSRRPVRRRRRRQRVEKLTYLSTLFASSFLYLTENLFLADFPFFWLLK